MKNLLYFLIAIPIFLYSCKGIYNFGYTPSPASEKIYMPALVNVNVDMSNINIIAWKRFKELEPDIKYTLKKEIEQVFANVVDNKHVFHNIIVEVEVDKLNYREKPWPIFFPSFIVLSYIGGPMFQGDAKVEYSVFIYDINGKLIKKYNQSSRIRKYRGLYWGNKNMTPGSDSYVLYKASSEAMNQLKTDIIDDKNKILKYKFDEASLVKRDTIRIIEKEKVYVNTEKNKYEYKRNSDVDINIPKTNIEHPYRFALIIGNEDYASHQLELDSETNVDFARNDANAFKEYAKKVFGIPDINTVFLLDATSAKMKQAIAKMNLIIKNTQGKAEVFVYFAGHGLPDENTKDAYLIPVDVSGKNPTSGIKLDFLYSKLSEYPAKKVTVFLDACFSGGARNKTLVEARGFKLLPRKSKLSGNLIAFASSSGTQSSFPYKDKEHGLFTYFLLKKIQETGGDISYKELSEYLRSKIALQSVLINDKEQIPQTHPSSDIENSWGDWRLKE